MAQRVQIILEDDYDGGEADETVSFALDGAEYEIDLSSANAAELRNALAPWLSHARKVGGRRRSRVVAAKAPAGGQRRIHQRYPRLGSGQWHGGFQPRPDLLGGAVGVRAGPRLISALSSRVVAPWANT